MRILLLSLALGLMLQAAVQAPVAWRKALDAQDRAALDKIAADAEAQAKAKPNDAAAQYMAALAENYRAEVLMELRDKAASGAAAEAGIAAAEKAVALAGNNAEYHRILGTLCGQVIPANVFAGLKYGRCAMEEVSKAIELDPKSAAAYLSRGVGNYYLPASFGGGPDLALKDIQRALQLDPKDSEAWVWQGVVLRKLNRNAEARQSFQKALSLNPERVWAKQQLDKTPAQ